MDFIRHSKLSPELLAEIKRLHFHTSKLADEAIGGQYRSAFRGRGIEFEEVREYIPGDEVRLIDWKVTARFRKPFIKSYHEERELTVMIAVDVSRSTSTGTRGHLRESQIAQIAAVLTMIAQNNNDKVGLVTYSDRLETYHPPRKARSSAWRIIHEVLDPNVSGRVTDLDGMFKFLRSVIKRTSIIFAISDFISDPFETSLSALAKRHDVTLIRVTDPADNELPNVGLISLRDPESGEFLSLDTGDSSFRALYKKLSQRNSQELSNICRRNRVGLLELSTGKPFISDLRGFFINKLTHQFHRTLPK